MSAHFQAMEMKSKDKFHGVFPAKAKVVAETMGQRREQDQEELIKNGMAPMEAHFQALVDFPAAPKKVVAPKLNTQQLLAQIEAKLVKQVKFAKPITRS